jgi:hypothetical protein
MESGTHSYACTYVNRDVEYCQTRLKLPLELLPKECIISHDRRW